MHLRRRVDRPGLPIHPADVVHPRDRNRLINPLPAGVDHVPETRIRVRHFRGLEQRQRHRIGLILRDQRRMPTSPPIESHFHHPYCFSGRQTRVFPETSPLERYPYRAPRRRTLPRNYPVQQSKYARETGSKQRWPQGPSRNQHTWLQAPHFCSRQGPCVEPASSTMPRRLALLWLPQRNPLLPCSTPEIGLRTAPNVCRARTG